MGEELTHALLVTAVLEVHVRHKTLRFCVTIWAFQKHSKVVKSAYVILSDVNDEAGISLLLNSNFTSFLLRSNLDSRLGDLYLLFVSVQEHRIDLIKTANCSFKHPETASPQSEIARPL